MKRAGRLAAGLGIPSLVVGLSVVTVSNSLPDLLTTITSSRKAVPDLAIGNVPCAIIAKLALGASTAALLLRAALDRLTRVFDFPALLPAMALFLWMRLRGQHVTRREGRVLLVVYALCVVVLAGLTLSGRS